MVFSVSIAETQERGSNMAKIVDSGNRTEFNSGAVRDIQEGKGRCDLLPLPEIQEFIRTYEKGSKKNPLEWIDAFENTGDRQYLIHAAQAFSNEVFLGPYTAILEYAKHMEDGCNKYGPRNWEKGIPLDRYVDSGIRHYLKSMRGDEDERHDRAFMWNMLCGAATCRFCPSLNPFPVRKENEDE